ncbi:MAG TPA: hypothetical protein DDX03_10530, partial [Firmicutes bacterium]|nr:hypothetical protein [Bacillota bacterium]
MYVREGSPMAEEKRKNVGTATTPHQVFLNERQQLKAEGVLNVDHFSDAEVTLETTGGVMVVKGENLHIQQLNLDDGRLSMTGTVHSLVYAGDGALKKSKGLLA